MSTVLVHGRSYPDRGYCYGVEDGLDGFCVHTTSCRWAGESWTGPNSLCVQPDPHARSDYRVCTCGHPGAGCYC